MTDYKVDLRGLFVPENLYKIDMEIKRLDDGDKMLVLLDDMGAEEWILRWAHHNGHDMISAEKTSTGLHITIKKGGYLIGA